MCQARKYNHHKKKTINAKIVTKEMNMHTLQFNLQLLRKYNIPKIKNVNCATGVKKKTKAEK